MLMTSILNNRSRIRILLAIVIVVIFVASGSMLGIASYYTNMEKQQNGNSQNATPSTSSSNGGTLSEGIVTTIVQESFNYFSPVEDYYITSMLYLPFATPEFPPLPSISMVLGQNVSHKDNNMTWCLSLKKNLKWDNGSPLNSTDLWFTMELYVQQGWISLNVTKISIVNSTTIKIQTNRPEPDFFDLWLLDTNSYIFPYESFHSHDLNLSANSVNVTGFKTFSNFHNIVADGPFVVTNYTVGENPMIFNANPYYYQGPPKMSHLTIRFFSSASSESAAMRSGEISAMWSNAAYNTIVAPIFTGIPDSTIHEVEPGEFEEASFNMHIWPFNTTQFRQALAYLTNQSAINSIVNSNSSTLVGYDTLTSSLDNSIGLNPASLNSYTYNQAKANELLSEIGIIRDETPGSTNYGLYVYENSSLPCYGNPVTIQITTTQLGYGDLSSAVELSNEWESAGFKVEITSISSSTIYATLDSATGWEVVVFPDPSGYPPIPGYLLPTITDSDNSTAYRYSPFHGVTNYNYSYASKLVNLSEEYALGTSQSNHYLRELAVYIDQVVPVIPLFDGEWWVVVSNNYDWGNYTNHTGVYSTQDLVVSTFNYPALDMVHLITVSKHTSSNSIYYIIGGIVAAVVVIGGVASIMTSKKHKKAREGEEREDDDK